MNKKFTVEDFEAKGWGVWETKDTDEIYSISGDCNQFTLIYEIADGNENLTFYTPQDFPGGGLLEFDSIPDIHDALVEYVAYEYNLNLGTFTLTGDERLAVMAHFNIADVHDLVGIGFPEISIKGFKAQGAEGVLVGIGEHAGDCVVVIRDAVKNTIVWNVENDMWDDSLEKAIGILWQHN